MNKILKLGIIGTGSRSIFNLAPILLEIPDVKIAAFCDTNPVRMKGAAEILNIAPNCYTSIEEMRRHETLDAVLITTPDKFHHDCAMQALQAGWNVFIDKPLATNAADGREIIDCAKKSGKTVMIGFNLRHHAVLKKLKELISQGVLGKIMVMENREFYNGGRTYMSRWNRLFSMTGGLWIHKASHDFDIFNWFLDFRKPLRVSSFASVNALNPEGIPFPLEEGREPGPDCTNCYYNKICKDRFMLNENEAKLWGPEAVKVDGYLKNRCMYLSDKDNHDNGIAMVEYEGNVKVSLFESFIGLKDDRLYTIVGDRATAEASLGARKIVITPRWSGNPQTTLEFPLEPGSHGGADPDLMRTFCRVCRGEEPSRSTAEQGLLSTVIGEAAERSRREHRMVEIGELLK